MAYRTIIRTKSTPHMYIANIHALAHVSWVCEIQKEHAARFKPGANTEAAVRALAEKCQMELEAEFIEAEGDMHDIASYKHGRCHLFALALHDILGYEIHALWDLAPLGDDLEELPTSLVHMYCKPKFPFDDLMIDAEGLFTKEGFEAFPCNEEDFVEHTAGHVRQLINKGVLCAPDDGEMEALHSYIEQHRHLFVH